MQWETTSTAFAISRALGCHSHKSAMICVAVKYHSKKARPKTLVRNALATPACRAIAEFRSIKYTSAMPRAFIYSALRQLIPQHFKVLVAKMQIRLQMIALCQLVPGFNKYDPMVGCQAFYVCQRSAQLLSK